MKKTSSGVPRVIRVARDACVYLKPKSARPETLTSNRMLISLLLVGFALLSSGIARANSDGVTSASVPALCEGRFATIVGTEEDDVIFGTEGDDIIQARGGNDRIDGFGGNDIICGGNGNDTIRGGDGDDLIVGGDDDDRIWGQKGHDEIFGDNEAITIRDGISEGFDVIYGNNGNDWIHGGFRADEIYGGDGDDVIIGGGNRALPREPEIFLEGGSGRDIVLAGYGGGHVELNDNLHKGAVTLSSNPSVDLFYNITDNYVALGDSFSAGDGVRPYEPGTNTEANQCRRSQYGWGRLLADELYWASEDESKFRYHSCTGAETRHIMQEGQYGEGRQLENVDSNSELVSLSIGGNDVLFSTIVQQCLSIGDCRNDTDLWERFERRLASLAGTSEDAVAGVYSFGDVFSAIARKMHNIHRPSTLVVANYPLLFQPDMPENSDDPVGMCREVFEGGNLVLSITADEALFLDQQTARLNKVLAERVDAIKPGLKSEYNVNIKLVDVVSRFEGHGLCKPVPWLNSIHPLDPIESFHPNERGTMAYFVAVADIIGRRHGRVAIEPDYLPKAGFLLGSADTDVDTSNIRQVIQEIDLLRRDNDAFGNKDIDNNLWFDFHPGVTDNFKDLNLPYSKVRSPSTGWKALKPYEGRYGITAAFNWQGTLSLISKDRYWGICYNQNCGEAAFGDVLYSGNFQQLCKDHASSPNFWCELPRIDGNRPWEGKLGITAVVRNRLDDGLVIFSGTSYWATNGAFDHVLSHGHIDNDVTSNPLYKITETLVDGKALRDDAGITAAFSGWDPGRGEYTYRIHNGRRFWVVTQGNSELLTMGINDDGLVR